MSNALALSAVTAVIQFYLNTVYNNPSSPFGGVALSSVAPDVVQSSMAGSGAAAIQVNLFLHQVSPNAAWRNIGFPSLGPDGTTQLQNPPLALDLHYLLTAYSSLDGEAEALLGVGVLMLHENPILRRGQISAALAGLPPSNPLAAVLAASGLADQIEMIKITPATLGKEEMAWLWTALKADYRPTFPFQVSVVLIEPDLQTTSALPVLSRSISIQAGPPPQLFEIQLALGRAAVAPGDAVTLTGSSLTGASQVVLSNPRLDIHYLFTPSGAGPLTGTSIPFNEPDDPTKLPAGTYSIWVVFENGSGAIIQSTNSLPIALAPTILAAPAPTAVANLLGTLVTLHCDPEVLPNQNVSLAMGSMSVSAQPFTTQTAVLSFQFPSLAAGPYLARLRVDGVESPVAVNTPPPPALPTFAGPWVTV
jgi:Pvc16 N-terminal domain